MNNEKKSFIKRVLGVAKDTAKFAGNDILGRRVVDNTKNPLSPYNRRQRGEYVRSPGMPGGSSRGYGEE